MHCDVHLLHNHSICFSLELSTLQNKNMLLSMLKFISFKTSIYEYFGGKRIFCNAFLLWLFPPSCFFRSWSPSYCVQPACILSLRRETSFSTYFSIWSRGQMMSSCGIWLLLWEVNIMLTCSFFKFGIMITFLIFMPSFLSKVSFNKGNTDLVHSALQCFPSCHSTYLRWTSAPLC